MKIVSYYARPASFTKGGVNTSRRDWMVNLARLGHEVLLADARGGFEAAVEPSSGVSQKPLRHLGWARWNYVPIGLRSALKDVDLLYLHEGWTISNFVAALVAHYMHVPFIVMPHGVYETGIVSTLRPIPFRLKLERWILRRARAIHVFLPGEIEEVRSIEPASEVIEVATGFSKPDRNWAPKAPAYLAWVGRLDVHHKGIDMLLEALARLEPETRPILRMVGPDYAGGLSQVSDIVARLGLSDNVELLGPKYGTDLQEFVACSSGFVHTPRWECLGRTVVDAMLLGVPTMVSTSAQLGALAKTHGLAITPGFNAASIAEGLRDMWSDPQRAAPKSTRKWAESYFNWDTTVRRWALHARELRLGPLV